jgi:SAM-dependent methyltransferase
MLLPRPTDALGWGLATSAQDSVVFDRAAGDYDATRGLPPGAADPVAALLAEAGALGPRTRLLEIGVGTGRIALPLARRGIRVVGADLSRAMLGRLVGKRAGLPVDPVRADAARLPFADASFDAALGVHVFHLIPRWREVLAELARVLRPGAPLLHGGDVQRLEDLWTGWRERVAGLGVEHVGVPLSRTETFLDEEGWRLSDEPRRVTFSRPLHLAQVVQSLRERCWSLTWRLDDAQLASLVEGVRRGLTERFGDLDRTIEAEGGFWVRAYLPPEAPVTPRSRSTPR